MRRCQMKDECWTKDECPTKDERPRTKVGSADWKDLYIFLRYIRLSSLVFGLLFQSYLGHSSLVVRRPGPPRSICAPKRTAPRTTGGQAGWGKRPQSRRWWRYSCALAAMTPRMCDRLA